jgi:hypothetical protein
MELAINRSWPGISVNETKIYTPSSLKERFKKLRYVGSGGEGCVYAVEEKDSGRIMALKIANNNWRVGDDNKRVAEIVFAILKQGLSLHLTEIHEVFAVECPVFAPLAGSKDTGEDFFDVKYKPEDDLTFPRRAFILELLDGDLSALGGKGLIKEETIRLAFRVQILSIQLILERQGVRNMELKYRNILYKKVGPEDVFEGNQIMDFDFWKYVFGTHVLYLPKMEYLIKIADYDAWMVKSEVQNPGEPEDYFRNNESISLKKVEELFTKPEDPKARVVEIFNTSRKLRE